MNDLPGNMQLSRGRGKRVPHGQIAWSHATAVGAAPPHGISVCRPPLDPIPVCSPPSGLGTPGVNNCGGDELWTNESWLVDGLGTPLRRFRKSHHLIRDRPALIQGDRKSDTKGSQQRFRGDR